MCDPLSVVTSVLTVAGVAATSCEYLQKALRRFSQVPKDLSHHVSAVQSLQSTFAAIAALEKDAPAILLRVPGFGARLNECMLDLQAMEQLTTSLLSELEKGGTRRMWAKMRWSSAYQRERLESRLSRIESYCMTFSMDLLLLNVYLGLDRTNNYQSLPFHSNNALDQNFPIAEYNPTLKNSQGSCLEHKSIRSRFLRYLDIDLFRFLCWIGPLTVLGWHNAKSRFPKSTKSSPGYGISLSVALRCCRPMRMELAMLLIRSWNGPFTSCSIHWNLYCPPVVPWDAIIINIAVIGDVDAMRKEFSAKSTPFDALPDGFTLLHLAASYNHFEMVKFLLQEGARVNAVNDFGETPLHQAIALSKDYNISRVLIEKGGDLQNRNVEGKTPLHTFQSRVSEQILRCHACLFDFSICDDWGMSLLHYLAWSSKTSKQTFKKYHELSNLDLRTVDIEGRLMIHLAAQRGNLDVIDYILYSIKNLKINQSDNKGRTVLHYAIENKRACDTVRTLIAHGASVWLTDNQERSALLHSLKLGNLPAAKVLLEYERADGLRAADCFGVTPSAISSHHKAFSTHRYLEQTERIWKTGSQVEEFHPQGRSETLRARVDRRRIAPLSASSRTYHHDFHSMPRRHDSMIGRQWKIASQVSLCLLYDGIILKCLATLIAIWALAVYLAQ